MLDRELWRLRGRRGLSLGEVQALTGIAKSSLSEWESGRHRPQTARLADLLNGLCATPEERRRLVEILGTGDALLLPTLPTSGASGGFFGDALRGLRLRSSLSQGRFAKLCGVSQPAVSKWEAGEVLPLDTQRERIAVALSLSAEEADVLWRSEGGRPAWLALSEAKGKPDLDEMFGAPERIDGRHGVLALLSAYHVVLRRSWLDPGWRDVALALAERTGGALMFSQRNAEFRSFTESFWRREHLSAAASRVGLQRLCIMATIAELRTSPRVPRHRAYDLIESSRNFDALSNRPWAAATASTILLECGEVDLAQRQILVHVRAMESAEGGIAGALQLSAGRLLDLGLVDLSRSVLERNWERHWMYRQSGDVEPLGIFPVAARIVAASGDHGQAERLLREGHTRIAAARTDSNATAMDAILTAITRERQRLHS